MDRGYDNNNMFLKLDELKQDYVIRAKSNRKLLFHNKWLAASELCARRKGKIKVKLLYKGRERNAYLSHVKVQITASRKNVYLILVYGITEHPMMLIINKEIRFKEDVVNTAMAYFSRWRIEEYFCYQKQVLRFENFRVRKLKAICALNFYITLCMAFLAHISIKPETSALKAAILQEVAPVKKKCFSFITVSQKVFRILSYIREGVWRWFRRKRPAYRQLCFKLGP